MTRQNPAVPAQGVPAGRGRPTLRCLSLRPHDTKENMQAEAGKGIVPGSAHDPREPASPEMEMLQTFAKRCGLGCSRQRH